MMEYFDFIIILLKVINPLISFITKVFLPSKIKRAKERNDILIKIKEEIEKLFVNGYLLFEDEYINNLRKLEKDCFQYVNNRFIFDFNLMLDYIDQQVSDFIIYKSKTVMIITSVMTDGDIETPSILIKNELEKYKESNLIVGDSLIALVMPIHKRIMHYVSRNW